MYFWSARPKTNLSSAVKILSGWKLFGERKYLSVFFPEEQRAYKLLTSALMKEGRFKMIKTLAA